MQWNLAKGWTGVQRSHGLGSLQLSPGTVVLWICIIKVTQQMKTCALKYRECVGSLSHTKYALTASKVYQRNATDIAMYCPLRSRVRRALCHAFQSAYLVSRTLGSDSAWRSWFWIIGCYFSFTHGERRRWWGSWLVWSVAKRSVPQANVACWYTGLRV